MQQSLLRNLFIATVFVIGVSAVGHAQYPLSRFPRMYPRPRAVPEIDPASATAALAMLAGGMIVIRARKR